MQSRIAKRRRGISGSNDERLAVWQDMTALNERGHEDHSPSANGGSRTSVPSQLFPTGTACRRIEYPSLPSLSFHAAPRVIQRPRLLESGARTTKAGCRSSSPLRPVFVRVGSSMVTISFGCFSPDYVTAAAFRSGDIPTFQLAVVRRLNDNKSGGLDLVRFPCRNGIDLAMSGGRRGWWVAPRLTQVKTSC